MDCTVSKRNSLLDDMPSCTNFEISDTGSVVCCLYEDRSPHSEIEWSEVKLNSLDGYEDASLNGLQSCI